jgi:hypothetical protein
MRTQIGYGPSSSRRTLESQRQRTIRVAAADTAFGSARIAGSTVGMPGAGSYRIARPARPGAARWRCRRHSRAEARSACPSVDERGDVVELLDQ